MVQFKMANGKLTATINGIERKASLRDDGRYVFTQSGEFDIGNGKTNFSIRQELVNEKGNEFVLTFDELQTSRKTANGNGNGNGNGKTRTATASTTAKEIATEQKRQLEIANIMQAVKDLKPLCDGNTATAKQLQTLANIYAEILPEFYPDKSEQFTATANIYAGKLAEKEKAEKQALANAKATTNEMLAELLEIL